MNIFTSAWHWFTHMFQGLDKQKVATIFDDVQHFANAAMPAVEMVVNLTPTPVDNIVVDALKAIGLTAEEIINQSVDTYRHGAKLDLAMTIFKSLLQDQVKKDGKLQIGATILATVEDVLKIDDKILRNACDLAFTLFTKAQSNR